MRTIFLSVIIMILCVSFSEMYSSGYKLVHSVEKQAKEKFEANELLEKILNEIQNLKDAPADTPEEEFIQNLKTEYSAYMFSLEDIASGINELFFPDVGLEKLEEKISYYIDAFPSSYGWMNAEFSNKKGMDILSKNFGNDLYPFVNRMPLYNIYSLDEEFIKMLLDISEIKNKNLCDDLFSSLDAKTILSPTDIQKILKINEKSLPASFLGTKTTFWRAEFVYKNKFKISAVICAIPDKLNNGKIEKYEIIERHIDVL